MSKGFSSGTYTNTQSLSISQTRTHLKIIVTSKSEITVSAKFRNFSHGNTEFNSTQQRFNEVDRMIDIINHKEKYADELFK